jgi:NAD(P)-dependent dehydrogenase (short-subunit alcohol dehydrogenase family)
MKTIVITGATSGIGKEVAIHLLKQGHRVISNTRNFSKSDRIKTELERVNKGGELFFYEGDFSSFDSVRKFASQIRNNFRSVDILINNAGTWEMQFIETSDGFETNLQVNHLSPMLLTLELIPLLEASGNARIVNTSSGAHRRNIFDLNDPEWRNKEYDGIATYSQSKLFNLLFSLHLKKMIAGKDITVNTVHPGLVRTKLFNKMGPRDWSGVPDAYHGARSTLYAALSAEMEGVSGRYIYLENNDHNISELAKDENLAEKLWVISMSYISK